MKEVFDFCREYWKELFYAFCAVLSLVCVLFRKCKVKVIDSAFEIALQKLPRWILIAEKFFSAGEAKKEFVLSEALKFISDSTHCTLTDVSTKYEARLSDALESILSTPTKKGEKCETKNEKIH